MKIFIQGLFLYTFLTLTFTLFNITSISAQERDKEKEEYPFFTAEAERNGVCHARVLTQAIYDTIPEQVLASPQYSKIEPISPKFDTIEEQIMIKAEAISYEIIPAVYETVEEEITVEDAYEYYSFDGVDQTFSDDCYRIVKERIEVVPREQKWNIARKEDCKSDNWDDCVFLVLESIPEKVHTEEIRVNDCPPPSPKSVSVPAKTKTISRLVVKTPAQIKETVIPAEYTTVKRVIVREYASTSLAEIPSTYGTIKKLIINTPGGKTEFIPVLCQSKAEKLVSKMQQKLKEKAYYKGKTDGKISPKFKEAMMKFQLDTHLPIGQFDFFTMKKLGVRVN